MIIYCENCDICVISDEEQDCECGERMYKLAEQDIVDFLNSHRGNDENNNGIKQANRTV